MSKTDNAVSPLVAELADAALELTGTETGALLARAAATITELKADEERIDWLIDHAWEIWYYGKDRVGEPRSITNLSTLREKIDSAGASLP